MQRDIESLVQRLTEEFGYPSAGAKLVAEKLIGLQEEIWQLFSEWWQTGKQPDLEIEGYSYKKLSKDYDMKPIAVFLTFDWLLREPQKAVASLKKGYDEVKY